MNQEQQIQDEQAQSEQELSTEVQEIENQEKPESLDENSDAAQVAWLHLKRAGVETGDVFSFSSPAVIGRFDPSVGPVDIDLGTMPEGSYVSRKHAKFVFEEGVWKVMDLGSSNGTYILRDDFERVEEAEVSDGTEISFGNARFVFRLSSGEGL